MNEILHNLRIHLFKKKYWKIGIYGKYTLDTSYFQCNMEKVKLKNILFLLNSNAYQFPMLLLQLF